MAEMLLTIQHGNNIFSPPVEEGIQIEWERTGTPGKLTFTTVGISGALFTEGDPVCFSYDGKPVFVGYVFTKKHDKENKISVTCYDQLRYLKNKFTYVFEKKTATQIVKSLCDDFKLKTGKLDNTNYVISAVAEENKSAFDIILSVLEDTLLNTGDMFVVYDDVGKLRVRNVSDMVSETLIYNETAENFDFSSSIDNETYNQVVLYYKQNNQITQMYTAQSPTTIKTWGTLRYFEEVKTPTIGQNKANVLLKLYNRKTRELKVNGAFGDITVRGGTLIPVVLELGEENISNYMLVQKVTHTFNNEQHTMDLTLDGAWNDPAFEIESKTVGELIVENTVGYEPEVETEVETEVEAVIEYSRVAIKQIIGDKNYVGTITLEFTRDGFTKHKTLDSNNTDYTFLLDAGTTVTITVNRYCDEYYGKHRAFRCSVVGADDWTQIDQGLYANVKKQYKKKFTANNYRELTVVWQNTYDNW